MPARMTAAVWARGFKNALICGVGVLMGMGLITFAVSVISGQPIRYCINTAFGVFWTLIFSVFVLSWLYGKKTAGSVLLDCGPRPCRNLFLVNAVVFLLLGASGGHTCLAGKCDRFGIWGVLFGVTFSIYWIIMFFGRLQICERGIWQYACLLKWEKLQSYEWEGDTLNIQVKAKFLFLGKGVLPVPPEQKTAVDDLLRNMRQQFGSANGAVSGGSI